MLKRSILVLIFLSAINTAWAAQAVTFPSIYEENGNQLPLRAVVHKRAFLARALTAGIYFAEGDGKSAEDFLKDVPKQLDVVFFVRIHQKDLAGYVRGKIWDNVSQEEFDLLGERLQRMAEYLVGARPNDRYAVTYIPGVGTRFEYNGKVMGTIEGEDFARGLFSVWVGKHPMDKGLKHQIEQKFRESTGGDTISTARDIIPTALRG